MDFTLKTGIVLSGLAQLALVIGSLAIPVILNWKLELSKIQPLIRQLFWTYAAYILMINLCFGLLSFYAADKLLDGSFLAIVLTGFIAVYWISRVWIQFLYFDRAAFPKGKIYQFAEAVLVLLFVILSIAYSYACYFNLKLN